MRLPQSEFIVCDSRCLLPLFFPQSHSHNTGQPAQDAGHAMQIVDTAGILDAQTGCKDGLWRNGDSDVTDSCTKTTKLHFNMSY